MSRELRARVCPHALIVTAALIGMIAVRLAYLGQPAGRDEAGFLMVGAGWDHGSSLYGHYWVDRPPLLIWIMELAGNLTALRLLGLLASVLMVLGVYRTASTAAGSRAATWAACCAALFSTAHWFGVPRTNGEMLASPFIAWGFALAAQALLRPSRHSWLPALAAGALSTCALLIKQTLVDPLIFATVLAAMIAWQQPQRRKDIVGTLVAGAAGALVTLAVALLAATSRGTTPAELFKALVTFRADAGEVIRVSASHATTDRLWTMLLTWAVSGLAIIAVLSLWHAATRRSPALVATAAVIAFESSTALLGGSYWAHYLLQLVPATALAAGLLTEHLQPRPRNVIAAVMIVATTANVAWVLISPPDDGQQAEVVGTWLHDSSEPGDTAVVAYGQPNVLTNAHMSSPYPYLWSLPVRTLDADLSTMQRVLAGADRPTWFVDWSGVGSWGITSPEPVQREMTNHYRQVATLCGRTIWLERNAHRDLAPVKECS